MGKAEKNTQDEVTQEVEEYFDPVSVLSGKLAEAIASIPEHFKKMDETELIETVRPSDVDWKLRLSLWEKIKEARLTGKPVSATSVHEDVCVRQTFFQYVLPNPARMAFIGRPVVDHTKLYESIARLALNKIFQMIQKTPIDQKYLPQILKLAETAGNRAWGPVVQRMQIQSKNVNIEVPGSASGQAQYLGAENPEALQGQINELQKRLSESTRDVTPKDPE